MTVYELLVEAVERAERIGIHDHHEALALIDQSGPKPKVTRWTLDEARAQIKLIERRDKAVLN